MAAPGQSQNHHSPCNRYGSSYWQTHACIAPFKRALEVRRQGGETLISGSIEHRSETAGEIDSFLSDCLRAIVHSGPLPDWPDTWPDTGHDTGHDREADVIARIGFHGIAPFLNSGVAGQSAAAPHWPASVLHSLRKETALATFWESSHRDAIAALIKGFAAAGIPVVITKGTALAYSTYPQPAMRRRGDSDIVILADTRNAARAVLRACGFTQHADPRPLQEDWHFDSGLGIRHAVDVHWRLNASAAISGWLERGSCFGDHIDLPQLAPGARGMGAVGNVILTSINRHSHGVMGYYVAHTKTFETDRLIWAVDLFLLTRAFGAGDWAALADQAQRTATAAIVLDGLRFAQAALGADVPHSAMAALEHAGQAEDVAHYFATASGAGRLRLDLAASPHLRDKARLLLRVLLPGTAFLQERFPDAQGWPHGALHLRRAIEGAAKFARGKA
jgi:hypothetical protein